MYKITGITRDGKHFRIITDNRIYAQGINVWRGSKWQKIDGRYRLLCRIYN